MSIYLSLAALRQGSIRLSGELTPEELGFETLDPCMEARHPIRYEVRAELMGVEISIEGRIETILECQCVRCLDRFDLPLIVDPWSNLLPLEGDEAVPIENESVDLTPQMREDSLLALPQHPVCRTECRGIAGQGPGPHSAEGPPGKAQPPPSAWSVLDTLKLDR